MSVLNKKPYINSVLDSLSSEELIQLKNIMNGSGDRTELLKTMDYPAGNRTNISTADKGIHLCSLQVGPTLYRGYLIYTDDYCTLLHFTDFNILSIFNIDVSKKGLETVSEYLDINELRRVAFETGAGSLGGSVTADEIDSESATAGQVLMANGTGGASWGDVSGGEDLPIYDFSNDSDATLQDLINLAGKQNKQYCIIKTKAPWNSNASEQKGYLTIAGNADLSMVFNFSFTGDYEAFVLENGLPSRYTSADYDTVKLYTFLLTNTYLHKLPLLPEATSDDEGKVPTINSSGIYELATPSSGGSEVIAYEGTSLLATGVVFVDWTLHRAIKDGNILWIVLCGQLNNTGSEQITMTDIFEVVLPSNVASNIYREDGSNCSNNPTGPETILSFNGSQGDATKMYALKSTVQNKISLTFLSGQNIVSGAVKRVDCRIPLFLDIGTVQS